MQSKESLSYPNLRKGLLSTYISTLQPYLQIDTEYILYPTYYSRKNNQNLLYRKDTEFQYIYNIKRKNKKVLIMTFVHENVVYTHRVEIHSIILAVVYLHPQFSEFGRKVLFPFLQPVLHSSASVTHGGLFQHLKAVLRVGEFFGENVYHDLFRLGYFAELVVCQDDAIPVVFLILENISLRLAEVKSSLPG